MNDLLELAIQAHGGLDRWTAFSRLRAELSAGGAIWQVKQQPGLLTDKVFEIGTHEERLTITPYTAPGQRSVFAPGRLLLETLDGDFVEQRDNP